MSRFEALLEELDVNVHLQYHDTTAEYVEEIVLYLDLVDVLTSYTLTKIVRICAGIVDTLNTTTRGTTSLRVSLRSCVLQLIAAVTAASDIYTTIDTRLAVRLLRLMDRNDGFDRHMVLQTSCKLVQLVDTSRHREFVTHIGLYQNCLDFIAADGSGTGSVVCELINTFLLTAECTTVSLPFWRKVDLPVFETMYRHCEHSDPHMLILVTLATRFVNAPVLAKHPALNPADLLLFCCKHFGASRHTVSLSELMVACVQYQYYEPETFSASSLQCFLRLDRETGMHPISWKVAAVYASCMLYVLDPGHGSEGGVDLSCVADNIRYYSQNDLYIMVYHHIEVILVLVRMHALPYAHIAQIVNVEMFQCIAPTIGKMLKCPRTPDGVRRTLASTLDMFLYFAGQHGLPQIGAVYAETVADAGFIKTAKLSRFVCPSLATKALLVVPGDVQLPLDGTNSLCGNVFFEIRKLLLA